MSTGTNTSAHLKYKFDDIVHMFNPLFCEVNVDTKKAKSSRTCTSTAHKTVAPTLCSQHRQQASGAFVTKEMAEVVAWLEEE
jgi:hypothetical protein